MGKLIENKAYECQDRILVFTGETKDNKAEFLEYLNKNEEEIMIGRSIPINRIDIKGDLLKIKDGEGSINTWLMRNRNYFFDSKENFQKLFNKYDNAII